MLEEKQNSVFLFLGRHLARWNTVSVCLFLGLYLIWCVSRWETTRPDRNIYFIYKVGTISEIEHSLAGLHFTEKEKNYNSSVSKF